MCRIERLYYTQGLGIVPFMRAILPIEENAALRSASKEIPQDELTGSRLKKLIAEMKTLLAKEDFGVALAAVQVGDPVRLFIVSGRALARGARNAEDEPHSGVDSRTSILEAIPDQVYINPRLLKLSRGKTLKHEGCLSVRGKWGEVPRAEKATLRYTDEDGREHQRGASGFLAHIFQHEMDHLEGILYTDKAVELYDDADKKE